MSKQTKLQSNAVDHSEEEDQDIEQTGSEEENDEEMNESGITEETNTTQNSDANGESEAENVEEKEEDEDEEEDSSSDEDEEDFKPEFVITENTDAETSYEKFHKELQEEMAKQKEKRRAKKLKKLQELEKEYTEEEYAKMPVKVVKPFDYDVLRQRNKQNGVIFLQKPLGLDRDDPRFKTQIAVKAFFADFGNVTRVQTAVEGAGNRKKITGYYVEFDDRNIAKRVALTLNGSPISHRDSRTLSIRYMPNFVWTDHVEKEERLSMYKKLMRAEAEKEMRAVKAYMKQKKLSKVLKTSKTKNPNREFKFKQRYVDKHDEDAGNASHLEVMPIFNSKE